MFDVSPYAEDDGKVYHRVGDCMTVFEQKYPDTAEKTARCPKCKKSGKSIRTRETDKGTNYCCGKCGESWYAED